MKRLRSFKGQSVLKKAAFNFVVKTMAGEQINLLKQKFQEIDKNGDGVISKEELGEAIKEFQDDEQSKAELQAIINEMDYNGNQMINYNDFLGATIDTKRFNR